MNARRSILLSLGLLLLAIPLSASAALVNINTADKATLMTLTGLGGTGVKAQAVIDYRTAHGPFAAISDIQNVAGIGPSTYAGLKDFITVADASAPVASSASTTPVSAGSAPTYVPPPSELTVTISGDTTALLEVPLRLSARVNAKGGANDTAAHLVWSFGDGSSGEGSAVEKTYRYVGTYLVVVTATDGTATARNDLIVNVRAAAPRIIALSGEGITLANDTSERLDLSMWRLVSDAGSFRIPEGTALLPNASVLFPYTIINLPASLEATLLYPDGVIAARYAPPHSVLAPSAQPSAPAPSYRQVQEVEPIISTTENVPVHDEAVRAPAAANDLAAAGAALPASSSIPAIFRSPWMLGLISVVGLASGAFILL